MEATEAALATVLGDPRRAEANTLPRWTGCSRPARSWSTSCRRPRRWVSTRATFFHAGPPIAWERASGPLRGALIGALLLEGLADDPEQAERALASGDGITLDACHHHRTVGPMAGVVSPSMWMFGLPRRPVHGGTAYCSLNEGLGKVLRYGAYGPEVIERLRWITSRAWPRRCRWRCARGSPHRSTSPSITVQMLQMGD